MASRPPSRTQSPSTPPVSSNPPHASSPEPTGSAGRQSPRAGPIQSTPLHPPPPSALLNTPPPTSFRYPQRLTRAQSRSIGSLGAGTSDHGPEFGASSSSLETSGSSTFRGRTPGRSHGSLAEILSGQLNVSTRLPEHRPFRGQESLESDAPKEEPDDERDDDGDDEEGPPRGTHASAGSDVDSERSGGRRLSESQLDSFIGGGSEGLLVPMGESFHVKRKRTRVLPTAHQSAELNRLLAETPFPSTARREELGRRIGLSARKVQVWFQNRRQKARRAKMDSVLKKDPSSSAGPSAIPDSPSVSPVSPRGPTRISSLPHPPSAWNAASGSSSSAVPGPAPYRTQYSPADSPQAPLHSRMPVSPVHTRSVSERLVSVPQSMVSQEPGPSRTAPETRRELSSSGITPDRRLSTGRSRRPHQRPTSVDRELASDTYPHPPPSSYHPYAASPQARARRSPSRRHSPVNGVHSSTSASNSPDVQSRSGATRRASPYPDVRLPPLGRSGAPGSPRLGRRMVSHSRYGSLDMARAEDRGPLSPLYPLPSSHTALASTSLSRRVSELAPASPDTFASPLPAYAHDIPPPFTLQPEPIWDNSFIPDYFQPRRLSWPSRFPTQRSTSDIPHYSAPSPSTSLHRGARHSEGRVPGESTMPSGEDTGDGPTDGGATLHHSYSSSSSSFWGGR